VKASWCIHVDPAWAGVRVDSDRLPRTVLGPVQMVIGDLVVSLDEVSVFSIAQSAGLFLGYGLVNG
jgi:hypothetical protein